MISFTEFGRWPYSGTILDLDSTLILCDPGAGDDLVLHDWDETIKPDLVLLSHADLTHLGGYVYGFKHLGWNKLPVYATLPVMTLGRMTLHDAHKSALVESFTIADIDEAFDWITSLRYSQPTQLTGRCQGININAQNAGHSVGGTIWKIAKGSENILYAIDWNHQKDQVVNGSTLYSSGSVPELLSRPTLLITDANNATSTVPTRRKRNEAFFDSITSTLLNNGSVLIPMDSNTRSLEVLYMLENFWKTSQPPIPFPVYFVSHTGTRTIEYAKSMLEWMSDAMNKEYGSSGGLYDLKHVRILNSTDDLPSGPKVVMATSYNLDLGFSQRILLDHIASSPANLIILMQRSLYDEHSLSMELFKLWQTENADNDKQNEVPQYISVNLEKSVTIRTTVPLQGEELKEYHTRMRTEREVELARTQLDQQNRNSLDDNDSDSEDEDDTEAAQTAAQFRTGPQLIALGSSALIAGTSYDLYLEDPQIQKLPARLKSFPLVEKKRRFDDYGEVIKIEDYRRADEDTEDAAGLTSVQPKADYVSGQKRKFGEVDGSAAKRGHETKSSPSKTVEQRENIHIKCRVRYIDMEGIHDGLSLKTIVTQVNPRRLVLCNATKEDKEDMANACLSATAFTHHITIPVTGKATEVSLDTNAYDVLLSDALYETLAWQKLGDQEVAHVVGKIVTNEEQLGQADEQSFVFDVLSKADIDRAPRVNPLFVGDIRLADVKKTLTYYGHTAEFKGEGVLLCDGAIALQKLSDGRITIEGDSTEFFKIRELIYENLGSV